MTGGVTGGIVMGGIGSASLAHASMAGATTTMAWRRVRRVIFMGRSIVLEGTRFDGALG